LTYCYFPCSTKRKFLIFIFKWRNYGDIDDSWDSVKDITEWFSQKQDNLSVAHGPGNWNDPDMLIIGNFGLSEAQSRTQMALWSIFAAPLIMSVDLRTISGWAKDILQNDNLIAINQDKLGVFGKKFMVKDNIEMWSKPLVNDRTAFVFLNPLPYGTPIKTDISLNDLGLIRYTKYNFYESFSGKLIGAYNYDDIFEFSVNPSGSVLTFWTEPAKVVSGKPIRPLPYMSLRAFK
jgi:alpha-N-acetylgalactosaminidase